MPEPKTEDESPLPPKQIDFGTEPTDLTDEELESVSGGKTVHRGPLPEAPTPGPQH